MHSSENGYCSQNITQKGIDWKSEIKICIQDDFGLTAFQISSMDQ